MKTELCKVRTGGKVVAEINFTSMDSIAEALENGYSEAEIIRLFNVANKIEKQAEERNKHVPARVGKEAKKLRAFNLCSADELIACAGDSAKLTALLESKLPEVEKLLEAESKALNS